MKRRVVRESPADTPLSQFFPEAATPLLLGSGRAFLARLGEEAARSVVEGVLLGENVKSRTEPLTRRRLVQVNGALLAMFVGGMRSERDFMGNVVSYAERQLNSTSTSDKVLRWPAQWVLGLTQKQIQNVLRGGNTEALSAYKDLYQDALADASAKCAELFGPIRLSISVENGSEVEMGWAELARVFSAIGASTLAIRGSEKSMYGKLFERLVLGSCLSVLGFRIVEPGKAPEVGEFWLSDSMDERECDATILIKPGHVARFDLGFIGKGNPEIVLDKLSRYAREVDRDGVRHSSLSIVVVDHVPSGGAAMALAAVSQTQVIQMSMSLWPRELANILSDAYGLDLPFAHANDAEVRRLVSREMPNVPILQFVSEVAIPADDDSEDNGTEDADR